MIYLNAEKTLWAHGNSSGNTDSPFYKEWITPEDGSAGKTVEPYVAPVPSYAELRAAEYPTIQDQLDAMYHDKVDGTTTWVDGIAAVKAAHPKTGV